MDLNHLVLHWFAGIGLGVAMLLVALIFASFDVPLSFLSLIITGELTVVLVVAIFAFMILAVIFGYIGVLARNVLYDESEVELELAAVLRIWLHGFLLIAVMMLLITVFAIFGLTISLTLFGSILQSSIALLLILGAMVAATIFGWINFELTELLY